MANMSWKKLSLQRKKTSSPVLQINQSSYKRGDRERANLMTLVKQGKISVDIAMQRAHGMGVASVPYEELSSKHFIQGEQFNFGVFLYSKQNKSTKCILHIDTGSCVVSFLHRGQELKKFNFSNLSHIDSTDDTSRIVISLYDMSTYEIDLGSLEDKNRVSRIFMSILDQHESGKTTIDIRNDSFKERRQGVIKEGILEKKGRSAAFLIWPRRYVKVLHGEIMYFKVGEENDENCALSILRLNTSNSSIRKIDNNGFSLIVNKKEYIFRIPTNIKDNNVEKERDDWLLAMKTAMSSHIEDPKEIPTSNLDQEAYLKSVVKSLNEELEQLDSVLSVIDAPIRASTQVKRVREIVHSLNDQIHSGLLSWTLRNASQNNIEENKLGSQYVTSNQNNAINTQQPNSNYIRDTSNPSYQQLYDTSVKKSNESYNNLDFNHHPTDSPHSEKGKEYKYKALDNISRNQNTAMYEQCSFNKEVNKYSETINDPYERVGLFDSDIKHQSTLKAPMNEYAPVTEKTEVVISSDVDYTPVDKVVNKQEEYVNLDSDHFAQANITPDLPPPLEHSDNESSRLECSDNESPLLELSGTGSKGENIQNELDFSKSDLNQDKQNNCDNNDPAKNEETHDLNDLKSITSDDECGEDLEVSTVPGAVPLPPPLPGNSLVKLPEREFLESKSKLKPLFWSKVPDYTINNSVWRNAVDRSEQLDLDLVESLFYVGQEKSKSISSDLDKIGMENNKAKATKSILNSKKAQNLEIFLNGFKLSVSDLDAKLNTITSGLSVEEIITLKRFQPTTEEVEVFKSIDVADIQLNTDIFMHKLCSIDNLNERLDILLTINELPDDYENINIAIKNIHNVLSFLKESKDLFRLFEYILSLGNYLNSGSARGQAYGFKLSSLTKLSEITSYNKKMSLLDYIVEELYKTDKSAVLCCKDIETKTLDVSVKGICAEAEIMKKDIERLESSFGKIENVVEESFTQEVFKFISTFKGYTGTLSNDSKNVQLLIIDLLNHFGETSSVDFDQWFQEFIKFINNINYTVSKIESRLARINDQPKKKANIAPSNNANATDKIDEIKSKSLPSNVSAYNKISAESFGFLNSLNNNSQVETCPTRSGYLLKYSNHSKKGKGKWEKKYFELTESGYLQYSKKIDSKSSHNVYLRGTTIIFDPTEQIIMLEFGSEFLRIKAENDLEALDWLNDLKYYSQN